MLCCTTPGISRKADCELLFVAVGQFSGRSSLHGALNAQCLILSLIALSLPWWERRLEVLGALVPQVSVGVAKQYICHCPCGRVCPLWLESCNARCTSDVPRCAGVMDS